MKILEHQGLEMFNKYGIKTPRSEVLSVDSKECSLPFPLVLKSQVLSGDRAKQGGIAFVDDAQGFKDSLEKLFNNPIEGRLPESVLAQEKVTGSEEFYISFSYDTDSRSPVLAISSKGGSGINEANIYNIDILWGAPDFLLRSALVSVGLSPKHAMKDTIKGLWNLFIQEQALLAEINPLFVSPEGECVAGDAKIILDGSVVNPDERPYLDLDGDIAVLASGGGASLMNLDALAYHGGRPANYVEYSGNPPAEVVDELTQRVFAKPGIKGAWVVGGTANFTDIYETLKGFIEGLRKVTPKPEYPIVIRRDGPRQKEAFEMVKEFAEREGYDIHLYGPEVHMAESAKKIVELAYNKE